MTKKKGVKQTYLFNNIELFSFRIKDSKDGVIIALRKEGIDFHLTIYKKEVNMISHFTYNDKESGKSKRSSDREFSLENFLLTLKTKLGSDFIQSYDDNSKCYAFTDDHMEFILGSKNEKGDEEIRLENIIQVLSSEPDFHNPHHFHLININQLSATYPLGYIDVETNPKIVLPVANKQIIVFPNNFISEILSALFEELSINTFINEIEKLYEMD